jgi:hypothetical protein
MRASCCECFIRTKEAVKSASTLAGWSTACGAGGRSTGELDEVARLELRTSRKEAAASAGWTTGFAYGEQFALPHPVAATDLHALVAQSNSVPPPPELPSQEPLTPG